MSTVRVVWLTILIAACGTGDAGTRELSANDSIPPATELGMASIGGQSRGAPAAQSIEGPMWRLVDYAGAQGARVAPSTRTAIRFVDGAMSGTGGCNRIGGKYTIAGQQLAFDATNSTMRACVGEADQHERAFLTLLGSVSRYSVADGRLTLQSASGDPLLIFEAEVERPIFGRAWAVQDYRNERGGLSAVLRGSTLTLTLAEDGSVRGNAGCNDFRTTYSAERTNLTLAPAAATKQMCGEPAGLMQQERAFLAALGRVASYYLENDTLQLRDSSGAILVFLHPVDAS